MHLFIDIGNTLIKFGIKDENNNWNKLQINTLDKFIFNKDNNVITNFIAKSNIKCAWISSVVPNISLKMDFFLKNKNINTHFVNSESDIGIHLISNKIGADIICNSVFANSKSEKTIIISLGTATVFSYIKNASIKGVIIAPGMITSLHNLVSNASQLHKIEIKIVNSAIGKNTQEALIIGSIKGHALMIEAQIKKIDQNANVFITGGNYEILKPYLSVKHIFNSNTVLEGLIIIKNRNFIE